jgi:hypothetical protein
MLKQHLLLIIPRLGIKFLMMLKTCSMNDICTPIRAKFSQATLESLLRNCLEGPSELADDTL